MGLRSIAFSQASTVQSNVSQNAIDLYNAWNFNMPKDKSSTDHLWTDIPKHTEKDYQQSQNQHIPGPHVSDLNCTPD